MSQGKFVEVGFRRYQVIELEVGTDQTSRTFNRIDLAERILVKNQSETPIGIRINSPVADVIVVEGGEQLDLPLKTREIFAVAESGTGKLTVIGYSV